MNKKFPLVTIITPTYNREDFIEETVLSVLKQNYPNLEYLILDDGSTDNTVTILKKYSKKIHYIYHKNMGEGKTVNKGLEMAKGEIITIVNSDDPLLPKAISESVETFRKNPDILVTYPDWIEIDERGNKIEKHKTLPYSYEHMITQHHCIPGPGTFFRKSLAKKIKGRDTRLQYVGDFDFWLRGGLEGNFLRIPQQLATFRTHANSQSIKNRGSKMAQEHVALTKKIFSLKNLPKEFQKLKPMTFCNTYIVAANYAGNNIYACNYFLKAFRSEPNYFIKKIIKNIIGEKK